MKPLTYAARMALDPLPEDWSRALAVVAHPDDMEYGAACAVAKWTRAGKDVRYVLVTRGEAGIAALDPAESVRQRAGEQDASCAAVGVTDLSFLDHPDGLVVESLELRRDLAAAIRRHQPEVIVSINHRDSWGGPSWNHADHRAVGRALIDAARDAANRWIFPDAGPAWSGTRFVAFNASPQASHYTELDEEAVAAGVASLECHAVYLANLDDPPNPDAMIRGAARSNGEANGVDLAVTFEIVFV
jgi:LmbE family N-acetylglucosaminyl deacetylase